MIMDIKTLNEVVRKNSGTSPTLHRRFDEFGFLVLENFYDVKSLIETPPRERGTFRYRSEFNFTHDPNEQQVKGSVSRYNYPKYRQAHVDIQHKITNRIGRQLERTYFYDRFYFENQALDKHVDRDSCEISVSLHIGSNPVELEWPLWITSWQSGEHFPVVLKPGDALLYKGCERPHWREKFPEIKSSGWFNKKKKEDIYYHQIFFHYVLRDGMRLQHAGDMLR
tara:strand:- start:1915 stop:2586 length:672 start_codon:yes stop_codon:yes gene_type:complete